MKNPAPLMMIVARRVIVFSLLAMLIQFAIVLYTYWHNAADLSRSVLEREISALASDFQSVDGVVFFKPGNRTLSMFTRDQAADDQLQDLGVPVGYYAQVRDSAGMVLFSNCGSFCQKSFLPYVRDMPADWQRTIRAGSPLTFAGGRIVHVYGQDVLIEFASIGDPKNLSSNALADEIYDHLVVPMSLMLFLVMGATILSLRKALEPVKMAAKIATKHNPQRSLVDLPTTGMPLEVVRLTEATNRVLGRARQLIQSQKIFASALSHEIRTPVSIAQLELEHLDHPRAKKAIAELQSLTKTLETLTALARLEMIDNISAETCNLSQIAKRVVASIAPYVYSEGKSIGYEDFGNAEVRSVPTLVEMLVRSLVENAIKHSVRGTTIDVIAGPGPSVTVNSCAINVEGKKGESGSPGIGLKILGKISEILGGKLVQSENPVGDYSTTYTFANIT
jgi:signal transduction histidine kinase